MSSQAVVQRSESKKRMADSQRSVHESKQRVLRRALSGVESKPRNGQLEPMQHRVAPLQPICVPPKIYRLISGPSPIEGEPLNLVTCEHDDEHSMFASGVSMDAVRVPDLQVKYQPYRLSAVELDCGEGKSFRAATMHSPSSGSDYNTIADILDGLRKHGVFVVGGDLNIADFDGNALVEAAQAKGLEIEVVEVKNPVTKERVAVRGETGNAVIQNQPQKGQRTTARDSQVLVFIKDNGDYSFKQTVVQDEEDATPLLAFSNHPMIVRDHTRPSGVLTIHGKRFALASENHAAPEDSRKGVGNVAGLYDITTDGVADPAKVAKFEEAGVVLTVQVATVFDELLDRAGTNILPEVIPDEPLTVGDPEGGQFNFLYGNLGRKGKAHLLSRLPKLANKEFAKTEGAKKLVVEYLGELVGPLGRFCRESGMFDGQKQVLYKLFGGQLPGDSSELDFSTISDAAISGSKIATKLFELIAEKDPRWDKCVTYFFSSLGGQSNGGFVSTPDSAKSVAGLKHDMLGRIGRAGRTPLILVVESLRTLSGHQPLASNTMHRDGNGTSTLPGGQLGGVGAVCLPCPEKTATVSPETSVKQ